jgi:hypothetical protein
MHDDVESLGCIGQLGRTDVDDPVLVLDLRVLGAISSKTLWNRPSVSFMMLSLVKQVTFLRLLRHRHTRRRTGRSVRSRAG